MGPEPTIDPSLLRATLREIQRRGDRWIGREHLLIAAAVAYEPSMLDADAIRARLDADERER